MKNILIVYQSKLGSVEKMARLIARGVESIDGCHALVRTVADVSDTSKELSPPESGDLVAELDELATCDGLIIGSPTRFGNMSASMKHFLDSTTSIWMSGALSGKPAGVFTSSSSMHGASRHATHGLTLLRTSVK